MRDPFEKELQDRLAGFNRAPSPSVWKKIRRRLSPGGHLSFLLSGWTLSLLTTLSISTGVVMCNADPEEEENKLESEQERTTMDIDTLIMVLESGEEVLLSTDTAYLGYDKGKELFRSQCAVCHSSDMFTDATGPALAGVTKRRSKEWLYAFTRNSQALIAEGDPQAVELWDEWKPTIMNSYPNLTDRELDAIYHYIELESTKN